ncbi:Ms4533A family Cys-rich leader peptide [Nocardia cyriacigeorgica]|uniref:Ms4533A family Cys-rich leader peptide n=1 Tax=Nocardia cyriacigeorgica TaxID=135487 RepID=UPI0038994C3B
MFPGARADFGQPGAQAVRAGGHGWSPVDLGFVDSNRLECSATVCRVSTSVVPQVRHELALIAVGCLVVADIHCR